MIGSYITLLNSLKFRNSNKIMMEAPVALVNPFNAVLALYLIGYQISICTDWSWIPMNKQDYQLPYQDKWSEISNSS